MVKFGEVLVSQITPEMSDGFIEADPASERLFYIPGFIMVGGRDGTPREGTFRLDPNTGSVIEQTSYISPNAVIGKRVIIESGVEVHDAVIENKVIVERRVRIYGGTQIGRGAIVGRKSIIWNRCIIGERAIIGNRSELENETYVAAGAKVPPHSHLS